MKKLIINDDGFICECGTEHKFDGYVYAHMNVELVHTCKDCGRKHGIFEGNVETLKNEK